MGTSGHLSGTFLFSVDSVAQAGDITAETQTICRYALMTVTGAASGQGEHRRWRFIVRWRLYLLPLVIAGAFRGIHAVAGDRLWAFLFALAVLPVFGAALVTALNSRSRRSDARQAALAGEGAWTAPCVAPGSPAEARTMIIDDTGVEIVTGRRAPAAVQHWVWSDIGNVSVTPIALGVLTPTAVVLHLSDGETAEIVMQSTKRWGYPTECAEETSRLLHERITASRLRSAWPSP